MPGKAELVELLDISAEVVEMELALLTEWGNDPKTEGDRRAEIRLTGRQIGVGFASALRRTAQALAHAKALSEAAVAHAPGQAHAVMVQGTAESVAARTQLPGPDLLDGAFTNAMGQARSNSEQAARNSEAILADCTQSGAAQPPALVATPASLRPRLARLDTVRAGAAKPAKPKSGKKPKGGGGAK